MELEKWLKYLDVITATEKRKKYDISSDLRELSYWLVALHHMHLTNTVIQQT